MIGLLLGSLGIARRLRGSLAGKVVLVTGASRGLGEAVPLGFAAAGARLVLARRKIEGVTAVAETIRSQSGEALAIACRPGKAAYGKTRAAEPAMLEPAAPSRGLFRNLLTGRICPV